MLRRRGVPSTLSLGTRRDGDDLVFHAWIATDGVVLNVGGGHRPYTTLATYYDPPPIDAQVTQQDVGSSKGVGARL